MTELHLLTGAGTTAATATADAVVVGVLPARSDERHREGRAPARPGRGGGRRGLRRRAGGAARRGGRDRPGGRGRQDPHAAATITAPLVVAVGLGPTGDDGPSAEQLRRASGAAARALAGTDHAVTTLSWPPVPAADALAATAEGTLLGAYAFTDYKKASGRRPVHRVDLATDATEAADAEAVLHRATAVATAVTTARDLVNTPPNDLFPASFAARAAALGEAAGLEVEVLDDAALAAGGYGGILGVGGGSSRKPRLVRLRWSGGPAPRASVALVGKGVTFDTGGISIKPAAHMDHMTSDMAGAAAVVATTVLAARLELPVAVTATVPMAENMPSSTAYRPGDVLRMYGGRTVEVLNTDAEGRLILADAIVRALEDEPDYLIETSTLTGAQLVALGLRTVGGDGQRRVPRPGGRAGPGRRRGRAGRCRSPSTSAASSTRGWPTSRTSPGTATAGCWRRGSSCASSCRTACRGRTSTSRARRSTPAGRTATRRRAARASRCGRWRRC